MKRRIHYMSNPLEKTNRPDNKQNSFSPRRDDRKGIHHLEEAMTENARIEKTKKNDQRNSEKRRRDNLSILYQMVPNPENRTSRDPMLLQATIDHFLHNPELRNTEEGKTAFDETLYWVINTYLDKQYRKGGKEVANKNDPHKRDLLIMQYKNACKQMKIASKDFEEVKLTGGINDSDIMKHPLYKYIYYEEYHKELQRFIDEEKVPLIQKCYKDTFGYDDATALRWAQAPGGAESQVTEEDRQNIICKVAYSKTKERIIILLQGRINRVELSDTEKKAKFTQLLFNNWHTLTSAVTFVGTYQKPEGHKYRASVREPLEQLSHLTNGFTYNPDWPTIKAAVLRLVCKDTTYMESSVRQIIEFLKGDSVQELIRDN
jgi:hypothetical protein